MKKQLFIFVLVLLGIEIHGQDSTNYQSSYSCVVENNQQVKLLPFESSDGDYFGQSVSITDDYAFVGAYKDDTGASEAGAVYVYKRVCDKWCFLQKLVNPEPQTQEWFGFSVAVFGNYAVIGCVFDNNPKLDCGSAYIYKLSGDNWVLETKLNAFDAAIEDGFGGTVALCGKYALISAHTDDYNGYIDAGSAYIYENTCNGWIFKQKIIIKDPNTYDMLGYWGISINEKYAVLGAHKDDCIEASGAAYVFTNTENGWIQEAKLMPNDPGPEKYFGRCVSLFGDYILVGAHRDYDVKAGAAYIFKHDESGWKQIKKLTAFDAAPNDRFGYFVSIGENYAAVGAVLEDNENGTDAGSAYVYKLVNNEWTFLKKIIAFDGSACDRFGQSVSLTNNYLISSAILDDDKGTDAGAAYIFSLSQLKSAKINDSEIPLVSSIKSGLLNNYPNPFKSMTTVSFTVEEDAKVVIEVFDLMGRNVAELYKGYNKVGKYELIWNATSFNASAYYIRMQAGNTIEVKKCILLK